MSAALETAVPLGELLQGDGQALLCPKGGQQRRRCRRFVGVGPPTPVFSLRQLGLPAGEVHSVETRWGPLTVTVGGAPGGAPCLTLHDVGLNHRSCFQGLLLALGPKSLLQRNYTLYHIDAPGCQVRGTVERCTGAGFAPGQPVGPGGWFVGLVRAEPPLLAVVQCPKTRLSSSSALPASAGR